MSDGLSGQEKGEKERRIEKRTILRFCDNEEIAIRKRPGKGLLAGLYEFPNVEGHLNKKEVIEYAKSPRSYAGAREEAAKGEAHFQSCGMAYDRI